MITEIPKRRRAYFQSRNVASAVFDSLCKKLPCNMVGIFTVTGGHMVVWVERRK